MARNSVSNTVLEASRVLLANAMTVHGVNTYTVASNFLSWDATNSYTIESIAQNFGTRYTGDANGIVGGGGEQGFMCGGGVIGAFDFGLLYSVFTAMVMAKVELGPTFPVVTENIPGKGIWVTWFGNDIIVYAPQLNLIIPIRNADVEKACAGNSIVVNNFCSRDTYKLEREGKNLYILTQSNELYLVIPMPECPIKTYAIYFQEKGTAAPADMGVSWDEGSALGALIGNTNTRSECLDILNKYKLSPTVASVVCRDDLVIELTERYLDTTNFFGSICFTDKEEIAIAVNFRNGLFVYYPWFVTDASQKREVKVDPAAKFPEFYNVTNGCNHILRYSGTVVHRPLTSAQMDFNVLEQVKEAFLNMQLARIPIQAAFGRVVIPEEVLIQELTGGCGESLFCMVPVGIVGPKLVCLSADSMLTSVTPSGWGLSSYFYDITEVANNVER